MWADPHHSAVVWRIAFVLRVMGDIMRVSVRMQMNVPVTGAMHEGWHVCKLAGSCRISDSFVGKAVGVLCSYETGQKTFSASHTHQCDYST